MLLQQTVGELLDSRYLGHPHVVHIFHFLGGIDLHFAAVLDQQQVAVVCDGIPVVKFISAVQAILFCASQLEFHREAPTYYGVIVQDNRMFVCGLGKGSLGPL